MRNKNSGKNNEHNCACQLKLQLKQINLDKLE